jgi:excisionase family DNA binding protein
MSLRTVRHWIDDEIIPSTKLGGARLVARADLERLLSPPPTATEDVTEEEDE